MNQYTEKTDQDGQHEITMLSTQKSENDIVSLVVKDKGEVMFMDTNLERLGKDDLSEPVPEP